MPRAFLREQSECTVGRQRRFAGFTAMNRCSHRLEARRADMRRRYPHGLMAPPENLILKRQHAPDAMSHYSDGKMVAMPGLEPGTPAL